uniref:Uncharacterized protein n=1 Tax=Ditylum brightwellii TaxID=49249 RepID=A0A7S4QZ18_9STRA
MTKHAIPYCSDETLNSSNNTLVRPKFVSRFENFCSYNHNLSQKWGIYIVQCLIQDTLSEITTGCRGCKFCFFNVRTGLSVPIQSVLHWSWNRRSMFIMPSDGYTEVDLNDKFAMGDEIIVSIADFEKREEDNFAVGFVHGRDKEYLDKSNAWLWAPSMLKFGFSGSYLRDYTVFTETVHANIKPGESYVNRQYIMVDSYKSMTKTANDWVNETMQAMLLPNDHSGDTITLWSNDDGINGSDKHIFGASIGNGTASKCSQGVPRCIGSTAPGRGLSALFEVRCGDDDVYVGHDKYHFSPQRYNDTLPIRSYVCDGRDKDVRPQWKLLGFFPPGRCNSLNNSVFVEEFCNSFVSEYSAPVSPRTKFLTNEKLGTISPSHEIRLSRNKNAKAHASEFVHSIHPQFSQGNPSLVPWEAILLSKTHHDTEKVNARRYQQAKEENTMINFFGGNRIDYASLLVHEKTALATSLDISSSTWSIIAGDLAENDYLMHSAQVSNGGSTFYSKIPDSLK